jgi:segregation and condensation protein B
MASEEKLKQIVEAALLAAGRPLSLDQVQALFEEREQPEKKVLREVLTGLKEDYEGRGIEVVEVGSGFRIQVRAGLSPWVSRLWSERPPKYSRALLETLALIAYRQPITRGEIEDIRGVSVSSNIIKTLTEREWVRVVGHRDVPGKPALYATTREFLDYFNLKGLNDLPTLAEIRDLDSINRELELSDPDKHAGGDLAQDEMSEGDSPEDVGDAAETDDEVIAQNAELETETTDSQTDEPDEVDEVDESVEPDETDEALESGASDEAQIRAVVESSDNVIELAPELKKANHDPE